MVDNCNLCKAAETGNIEDVRHILATLETDTSHTHSPHHRKNCALAVAASGGYLELVCLLLNTGADVHAADFFHWTPLHQAVHQNRFEVAKILIENGADASANPDETPLMIAAGYIGRKMSPCTTEMFQLLVDAGARVDDQGLGRKTPLHWAARACHVEAAKFLLENGAKSISMRDGNLMQPIHYACTNTNTASFRSWANDREYPCSGMFRNSEDDNTVDMRPMIQLLLENGADVNAMGPGRSTPLFRCMMSGNQDRVRLILDKGADLNSKLHCGKTIREYASDRGRCTPEIFKMIEAEPARRLAVREFTISCREALAMALHERLGELSLLSKLEAALVTEISDLTHPLGPLGPLGFE